MTSYGHDRAASSAAASPPSTSQGSAACHRLPRLPPIDTGAYPHTSSAQFLHRMFAQMCNLLWQFEGDALKVAETATMAAEIALAKLPCALPDHPRLLRLQRGREGWQPHHCSAEQEAELAALGSRVRELCLRHAACAEELVSAAASLTGKRLQQLLVSRGELLCKLREAPRHLALPLMHICCRPLSTAVAGHRSSAPPGPWQAALRQSGEGLLADFLRSALYSERTSDEIASGCRSVGLGRSWQAGPLPAGPAGSLSPPHALLVAQSACGSIPRARQARKQQQHTAALQGPADGFAGSELACAAGWADSAEAIAIPQVFRTRYAGWACSLHSCGTACCSVAPLLL